MTDQIKLTPKHNEAAGNLISLFVKNVKAGKVDEDIGVLAAYLGMIAGLEIKKLPNDGPDGDERENLIGFLLWVGEVLKFKPVKKEEMNLSPEASAELLGFVNSIYQDIDDALGGDYFDARNRACVAMLAVATAVENFGNDKEPFTFSIAATLAIGGLIFSSQA